MRPMRDGRWPPEETSGRISEERPDLAASDSAIYRAVGSGSPDCGLPGAQAPWKAQAREGRPGARGQGAHDPWHLREAGRDIVQEPDRRLGRQYGRWQAGRRMPRHPGRQDERMPCRRQGRQEGPCRGQRGHREGARGRGRPDRGKELSDAEGLQEALGAPVYSCHPHHPWERGTNENTNGLLRDWFPKGESLDDVSDSEVQEAYDSLSRRPRKRLKWKCPGRSTTASRCTCSEDSP